MIAALVLNALVTVAPANTDYYVYVTAESSDEVYLTCFDGSEVRVVERIPVGYMATEIEGPHGLTIEPGGEHWYLTMAHGKPFGTLYKYRTQDNELVGQVELGLFPATMQISSATGLLYCVNFDLHGDMSPSTVSIVDPEEMVEVAQVETGAMPHGSRLSVDGTRHYSCAMMTDEVFELDALGFECLRDMRIDDGTGAVTRRAEAGHHKAVTKPTWILPHPSRDLAYVCLNGAAQVAEIDLEEWRVTRRFPTAKAPYNLDLTPDGKLLVVTYKAAASVGVWDLESGREIQRIETSRPVTHGVVISPDGRYAFVSNESVGGDPGTLDVMDLKKHERLASVELGLQPGGIAFWKMDQR